jgi:hypothetical protein
MRRSTTTLVALAVAGALAPAASAEPTFGPWSAPVNAEAIPGTSAELNSDRQDGCPIESPDGLSLFLASTRPRSAGDLRTDIDIWVADRASRDAPWGPPRNLGDTVNSTADDFCPTPIRTGGLLFVSRRVEPGICGGSDMYFTRRHPTRGYGSPRRFPCAADGGPNTTLDEMGPSYVETGEPSLYFSSGPDIVVSDQLRDGEFGRGVPVAALNSPAADIQPNVRRDGLEVVFASNRAGTQDIWSATRPRVTAPWPAPTSVSAVNTPAAETRPSLSRDGTRLHFGRATGGPPTTDVYVSTRTRHGQ